MSRRLAPLGALLAIGALGTPAAAQDERRIAQGVSAGGVDLSGLTVDEATARLDSVLGPSLQRDLVLRAAGTRWPLTMEQARLRFDAVRTAKRALRASPPPPEPTPEEGAPPPPAGEPPAAAPAAPVLVPVAVTHSRLAVRAFVASVARTVYRPPRNARLVGLRHLRVQRSRQGHGLDRTATVGQIDAMLDGVPARRFVPQRLVRLHPTLNALDLHRLSATVVTIDRSTFTLRLFKHLRFARRYPIAVGMAGLETPAGRYSVQEKKVDPAWQVPDRPWAGELAGQVIPAGDPKNALRARWLGIGNGVGIHGTAEDWSIGTRASHGCIRMHVWDVEDLYRRVPLRSAVVIR